MSVLYVRNEKGEPVPVKTIQGQKGDPGKSAYQYALENGYTGTEMEFGIKQAKDIPTVTQNAGQSETLVMSQKAVTDLVSDALGENTVEYETVDSVDQMVDTSKSYILSSTGTLWRYTEKETVVEHNAYDAGTALFNKRLNGSGEEKDLGGSLLLPAIEQTYDENCVVTIKGLGKLVPNYGTMFALSFFDASGSHIELVTNGNYGVNATLTEKELPVSFTPFKPNPEVSGLENTAQIRIKLGIAADNTSISSSDCEGLVVNFSTKNKTETVGTWVDSGIKPSDGGGGNYVAMLMKVEQNTTDISEVNKRVSVLETQDNSLVIPSWWEDAVAVCVSKIKALQVGRNCVTFPFFSDHHDRGGYAGVLIAKVMKECGMPYCFFGGDAIGSNAGFTEDMMIQQDRDFDVLMSYVPEGKFCRAAGNHDGYYKDADNEQHFYDRWKVYELFFRAEGVSQNKHFGGEGTYYYVDDIASMTRWIVLDSNTNPTGGYPGEIDDAQLNWLKNTALSFNESGWGVVIITHIPVTDHYHARMANKETLIAAVNEYTSADGSGNKPVMIGWFSGHIHRDRIFTHTAVNSWDDVRGEDDQPLGFTQVTITSDNTSIAYKNDDGTASDTLHPIGNDDKSHAIDFVTINRNTRTVNLTRLGIGEDRSYSF